MSNVSITESTSSDNASCLIVLIGFVFLLVGVGMSWYAAATGYDWWRIQAWEQKPCTIRSAKLDVSKSDDGTTYRADFTYDYSVAGEQYVGSRDSVVKHFGNKSKARALLERLPVGTKTHCYVDPSDPSNATLDRSFPTFSFLLTGLFGLGFTGGGAAAFWFGRSQQQIKKQRRVPLAAALVDSRSHGLESAHHVSLLASESAQVAASTPGVHPEDIKDRAADVPQRLKAVSSKLARLLGAIFICLFWNGIVSVFVYQMFTEPLGWFNLFLGLFLTPFVLIGLVLVAAVLHIAVSLLNPSVTIALSTGAVRCGDQLDVAWEIGSGLRSIKSLNISVIGSEWAQYRRGTDTITDESIFEVLPVASADNARDIRFGSRTITIPASTMHTIEGSHNQINWTVRVFGRIPWWPDVAEEYSFRVAPPKPLEMIETGEQA